MLDLFDLVNYALLGLIVLALYAALRRANESAMAIAATSTFISIALCFASNQAFSMLSLSGRYAAATTEAQRSMLLAAGEALLAIDNPGATHSGAGSTLSLLLVTLASLIISIVMLRSDVFSRTIAVVGLVAEGFQLGHFIALAFAPAMLAFPASLAAPLRLAWYILIARRLLKIASGVSEEQAQ